MNDLIKPEDLVAASRGTTTKEPREDAIDQGSVAEWRELNIGSGEPIDDCARLDLRDIGFVYRVSDAARAEIAASERRAQRVLSTAHLYWFGR